MLCEFALGLIFYSSSWCFPLKTHQVWSYFNFNHMISFHTDAAGLIEEI